MQLVCPCMNISVNVVVEDEETFLNDSLLKPETVQQYCDDDAIEDDFFALCTAGAVARFVLDSEKGIVEKHPVFVKRRRVDRWEVRKCVLCNADAFALGSNFAGQALVNMKLFLKEESVIAERRKSVEISPVFQVILPKTNEDLVALSNLVADTNNTAGNRSGFVNGATTVIPRGALHAVQACVGQYLRREQESMEDRIRLFTEQQQAAFDRLKIDAKSEKAKVLSLLVRSGVGVGVGSAGQTSYESYWSSGSNSFGGTVFGDEEFDSAVPLSPLSLTSGGDPSPGLDAATRIIGGSYRLPVDAFAAPLRPKAHSNPASLANWKRKRHSGGPGLAPSLSSHPEEQQDIFSFEEHENDDLNQTSYLPADDEGDTTDDSGTGEDYSKYYPPPPPPSSVANSSAATLVAGAQPRTISSSSTNHRNVHYCTSLPVRVPEGGPTSAPRWSFKNTGDESNSKLDSDEEEELEEENEENSDVNIKPKDVGASMQALARSIQNADDPERLFGERPQRRRWKTGEDNLPQQFQESQAVYQPPIENRRKATIVVLFKEEQNF